MVKKKVICDKHVDYTWRGDVQSWHLDVPRDSGGDSQDGV